MKEDGITCETALDWSRIFGEFTFACGDRTIMEDPERRAGLLKGFTLAYLRLPEDIDGVPGYSLAVAEFHRRCTLIDGSVLRARR